MAQRRRESESGFTLIEVMMVLVILGLVLGAIYGFLVFGYSTFASGEGRASVQTQNRIASDHITREIRNAVQIELLNVMDSTPTPGFRYISLGPPSGGRAALVQTTAAGNQMAVTQPVHTSLFFALSKVGSGMLLRFEITSSDKGHSQTQTSEVYLNNIDEGALVSNRPVVRYRLP